LFNPSVPFCLTFQAVSGCPWYLHPFDFDQDQKRQPPKYRADVARLAAFLSEQPPGTVRLMSKLAETVVAELSAPVGKRRS